MYQFLNYFPRTRDALSEAMRVRIEYILKYGKELETDEDDQFDFKSWDAYMFDNLDMLAPMTYHDPVTDRTEKVHGASWHFSKDGVFKQYLRLVDEEGKELGIQVLEGRKDDGEETQAEKNEAV